MGEMFTLNHELFITFLRKMHLNFIPLLHLLSVLQGNAT